MPAAQPKEQSHSQLCSHLTLTHFSSALREGELRERFFWKGLFWSPLPQEGAHSSRLHPPPPQLPHGSLTALRAAGRAWGEPLRPAQLLTS